MSLVVGAIGIALNLKLEKWDVCFPRGCMGGEELGVIPGEPREPRRKPFVSSPAEHCVSNARGRGPRWTPP